MVIPLAWVRICFSLSRHLLNFMCLRYIFTSVVGCILVVRPMYCIHLLKLIGVNCIYMLLQAWWGILLCYQHMHCYIYVVFDGYPRNCTIYTTTQLLPEVLDLYGVGLGVTHSIKLWSLHHHCGTKPKKAPPRTSVIMDPQHQLPAHQLWPTTHESIIYFQHLSSYTALRQSQIRCPAFPTHMRHGPTTRASRPINRLWDKLNKLGTK